MKPSAAVAFEIQARVELPNSHGQASGSKPVVLSPNPSPSWSIHWVPCVGKASAP